MQCNTAVQCDSAVRVQIPDSILVRDDILSVFVLFLKKCHIFSSFLSQKRPESSGESKQMVAIS